MRTIKKPELRKQEILEGAMAVFLRNGYEKTTITDISKELGISQGLCYRYFVSKEEIYDAVIDTYASMIAEENIKNRSENQSIREWVDNIPSMIKCMEKAEKENQQFYALLHNPQNEKMHKELCLKVGEKLLPSVTKVLEQAKEKGEIQISDCGKTASFGLFGQIGLLISEKMEYSSAIKENWLMLLGIK